MAPIPSSPSISGEHIRQASRSIASALPSVVSTLHDGDASEIHKSIHQSSPFIPRAIQHTSKILPRASVESSPSISILKRQTRIFAVPIGYAGLDAGPPPGTVAGIVLGSVAGFLLILWLIYTCFNMGLFPGGGGGDEVVEEEVVRRRSRSPRRSSRMRRETIEISKSRSPPRRERERERERIVVDETRRVSRPPEPEPSEGIDDIVEVIEDHSPTPPPSRRTSRRTSGGFRTVDPSEFGGGRRPMRNVR